MNTNGKQSRFVVLTAVEGLGAEGVAQVAARFAAGSPGGELHLIHVMGMPPAGSAEAIAALDAVRGALQTVGNAAQEIHKGRIVAHVAVGDPTREILSLASRLEADLLVVATHGRKGIDRLLLGSVAEQVVRLASCPVVVVRDKDYQNGLAPEIEPPCPACLETQASSGGEKLWCAHHSEHHPHGHTYSSPPDTFVLGASTLRP